MSGITEDYHKVRDFFIRLGYAEFTYTRWDWMKTHSYLDRSAVGQIGIWEDYGQIVGIATFDCQFSKEVRSFVIDKLWFSFDFRNLI